MAVTKDWCNGKRYGLSRHRGVPIPKIRLTLPTMCNNPICDSFLVSIGITDIEVVHADNLMGGEETRSQDLAPAQAALQAAVSR